MINSHELIQQIPRPKPLPNIRFLRIYGIVHKTQTLGPFTRFALWVQGCPRSCPGCMTPEAQLFGGGTLMDIDELAEHIIRASEIEGITISGGEPFIQAEGLVHLIQKILKKRELGFIVYTGYVLKELIQIAENAEGIFVSELLKSIDILIDGPYIKELDDRRSLRGSSNQMIHLLTSRYADVISQYYGKSERHVELHLNKNELFLVGIPGPDALEKWRSVL